MGEKKTPSDYRLERGGGRGEPQEEIEHGVPRLSPPAVALRPPEPARNPSSLDVSMGSPCGGFARRIVRKGWHVHRPEVTARGVVVAEAGVTAHDL